MDVVRALPDHGESHIDDDRQPDPGEPAESSKERRDALTQIAESFNARGAYRVSVEDIVAILNAGDARTYRVDRMRSARLTADSFEPREGFDPNYLRDPGIARVWYSPAIARWKRERGARTLKDGAALGELGFKTEDWIVGEILNDRGEAVVLEPDGLRATVAKRAGELLRELKVSRVRV